MHLTSKSTELFVPSKKDIVLAEKAGHALSAYIRSTRTPLLQLIKKGKDREGEKIDIPAMAIPLLINILSQMAEGNAVTLIPIHAELTTQEAADLLNVSRPYFVRLLSEGKIPFRKVGMRRRILAKDVLHYKTNVDKKRLKVLEELSAQAQKLDLGY